MPIRICAVDGCGRPHYARALCEPHYRRRRRTGTVDTARPIGVVVREPCMVHGCGNTSSERGLCHGHYLRLIRVGSVQADRPLSRRVNAGCTATGCLRPATAKGLCPTHRARKRSTGSIQPDLPVKNVEGTGHVNHGYRVVPIPEHHRRLVQGKRKELEHRYVMALMLGRPLTSDESVHHRNGDRLDNSPANLELWSRHQPRGQRVSDKIDYAIQLLRRYLPDTPAVRLLLASADVPPTGFEPVSPP